MTRVAGLNMTRSIGPGERVVVRSAQPKLVQTSQMKVKMPRRPANRAPLPRAASHLPLNALFAISPATTYNSSAETKKGSKYAPEAPYGLTNPQIVSESTATEAPAYAPKTTVVMNIRTPSSLMSGKLLSARLDPTMRAVKTAMVATERVRRTLAG